MLTRESSQSASELLSPNTIGEMRVSTHGAHDTYADVRLRYRFDCLDFNLETPISAARFIHLRLDCTRVYVTFLHCFILRARARVCVKSTLSDGRCYTFRGSLFSLSFSFVGACVLLQETCVSHIHTWEIRHIHSHTLTYAHARTHLHG